MASSNPPSASGGRAKKKIKEEEKKSGESNGTWRNLMADKKDREMAYIQ
jgi:hypothetical protein